eukprot:m.4903 g.4903  ORF g.4903 m.4903 type:complete len:52 (+) comp11530_c0_seq1:205-360(+)
MLFQTYCRYVEWEMTAINCSVLETVNSVMSLVLKVSCAKASLDKKPVGREN